MIGDLQGIANCIRRRSWCDANIVSGRADLPSQLDALKLHGRLALRDFIWLVANRHVQGSQPNIAIFGSRRSGTTLLMETLGANRGYKSVGQPDSVFSGSAFDIGFLPIRDGGQLNYLNEAERRKFSYFIDQIEKGEIHVNEPWRFWRSDFSFSSRRIVFKLTVSHGEIGWMTERFRWQTIMLLRHPLAQALSVQRLEETTARWQSRAPALLRNAAYREDHLDSRQVARAHDIWREGNALDRHVLGWVLENLQLLRAWEKRPAWCFVAYEALVLEPEKLIGALAAHLGLPDRDRMLAMVRRQSRTVRGLSAKDRKAAIRSGNRDAMLGSWRAKIDDAERAKYQSFLDDFGIDLYNMASDRPRELWVVPATSGQV